MIIGIAGARLAVGEIFISYSRRDWAIAEGLGENLNALGHRVWIDTGLDPRMQYAEAIAAALDQAQAVIVIWTASSIESEWVRYEAGEALKAQKLLQLRVDRLPVESVPPPFNKHTIYSGGGPEELETRLAQLFSTPPPGHAIAFDNPVPERAPAGLGEMKRVWPGSSLILSSASLGAALALSPISKTLAAVSAALAALSVLALSSYLAYTSISKFIDRFGRRMLLQSLVFGMMAGIFAGAIGGFLYANRADTRLVGTASPNFQLDVFTTRYIRVVVISAIVGTVLSYLVIAILRYLRLKQRDLGPPWSRRNTTGQLLAHSALLILLACVTALVADNLPWVGSLVDRATFGVVDWFGAGRCASITLYNTAPDKFLADCTVGDIRQAEITLIVAIHLWTVHVYYLRQAGGQVRRIVLSSAALIVIALALLLYFQFVPDITSIGVRQLIGQSLLIFIAPWLGLLAAAIIVIHSNVRSLEREAILNEDR